MRRPRLTDEIHASTSMFGCVERGVDSKTCTSHSSRRPVAGAQIKAVATDVQSPVHKSRLYGFPFLPIGRRAGWTARSATSSWRNMLTVQVQPSCHIVGVSADMFDIYHTPFRRRRCSPSPASIRGVSAAERCHHEGVPNDVLCATPRPLRVTCCGAWRQ